MNKMLFFEFFRNFLWIFSTFIYLFIVSALFDKPKYWIFNTNSVFECASMYSYIHSFEHIHIWVLDAQWQRHYRQWFVFWKQFSISLSLSLPIYALSFVNSCTGIFQILHFWAAKSCKMLSFFRIIIIFDYFQGIFGRDILH